MNLIFTLIFLFLLLPVLCLADTHNAASCSLADISTAISAASSGDTISVPAGNCTWTTQLDLTSGMNFIGSGVGVTVITSNLTTNSNNLSSDNYMIHYHPSPALDEPFRLSGFTFNSDGKSGTLFMGITGSIPLTKVRTDHNSFLAPKDGFYHILTYGHIYGVIDNNFFDSRTSGYVFFESLDNTDESWNLYTQSRGGSDFMYFEDNTGYSHDTTMGASKGGRYAIRYNTFNVEGNAMPLIDAHGGKAIGSNDYSTTGIEVYGNQVNGDSYTMALIDQRGGYGLGFCNNVVTSGSFSYKVREEYIDDTEQDPPANNTISGQSQHVSESYFWANLKNNITKTNCDDGGHLFYVSLGRDVPLENTDFFNHQTSFDGTVGMGCGILASRPATCTTGVGYWATTQSCSDLTGLVGANPSTPISGILYKCTAPDTWTAYYTPYTYPHPLRGVYNMNFGTGATISIGTGGTLLIQ